METKKNEIEETTDEEFLTKQELEAFPTTPAEIQAYLERLGLAPEDVDYRSSEYDLTDKADLVGVPLFLVQWEEKVSQDYGGFYVVVHAIRQDNGDKIVFADGGTGIAAQLIGLIEKRTIQGLVPEAWRHGLMVKKGLVRSDYDSHESKATGEIVPAGTTYYLG